MNPNKEQSMAIRNAVYGMTLPESLKLWQGAESTRKQMIWEAIQRYWPARGIEFEDYRDILKLFRSFNLVNFFPTNRSEVSEFDIIADYLGRVDDENPQAKSFEEQLRNIKKEPV